MFSIQILQRYSRFVVNMKCYTHAFTTAAPTMKENNNRTTVDSADIERHTKLAQMWWDTKTLAPLHTLNLIRVPFIRDGLVNTSKLERNVKPLTNKTILDVGCGGGILSEALARLGAKVTGIDASKELVEVAKQHSNVDPVIADNKPEYHCQNMEEHCTTHPNYYDGIVASEIIEHVNNKELFVKSSVDALKSGGRIFITFPTRTRLSQFTSIFLAEYVLGAIPKGTHQYEKLPTPTEVTFLLERNNCHVEKIYGAFFNAFTTKWSIVKPTTFFTFIQAVKRS